MKSTTALVFPAIAIFIMLAALVPGAACAPQATNVEPVSPSSDIPKPVVPPMKVITPSMTDDNTTILRQEEGALTGTLVFMSGTNDAGGPQLYTATGAGTNWARLTKNSAGGDYYPKWSPDGSKVIFSSNMEGTLQVYVINADGSNQTRLTNNSSNDFMPVWSPDGKKIVFASDRDNNHEIYVMNADGSNQVRITNNVYSDAEPAWSPDGNKIVFTSDRDGTEEIYVMNADGSNQERITNNAYTDSYPVWSPDGRKIVFQSNEFAEFQIFTMNPDGTGRTQLTDVLADNKYPSWSPDSTKIVFYSKRDCINDNGEIYIMNADGGSQTRITFSQCTDSGIASWKK